ncbi:MULTISPECIES: hypothetical protein [Pontibacillus]|uniref:Uncharacterized protein n=1 Tax=Pontibacillus chungwhensis TaxID=265426 RepID=A0ABY8UUS2_9BACI|nr:MULTISPECIES: hypothetical protein [Pontibacillus]MCD5323879.1 hypothetical protein [Pontibacillus sp. HN14]WIF97237.1 hypothetical protein QNI29_16045 [Pontibacillus chungwhensis]
MKFNSDHTPPTKRSQLLRYVLISLFIVAVLVAIMVQNNQAKQIMKPTLEQQPLLAIRHNVEEVEVSLIQLQEEVPYLVTFDIDPFTYSFSAKAYKRLNQPIQEINYSKDGELWVKRNNEWFLLDEDLVERPSSARSPMFEERVSFIKKVIKKGDVFQMTVRLHDHNEWSEVFQKRPIDIEKLYVNEEVWVVLLDDFTVEIVKK